MSVTARAALGAAVVVLASGCGLNLTGKHARHRSYASGAAAGAISSTTAVSVDPAGDPEPTSPSPETDPSGVAFEVAHVSSRTLTSDGHRLQVVFTKPVDPESLVEGVSWYVAEDDDAGPGLAFHRVEGQLLLDETGTELTFENVNPWTAGCDVRLIFTSALRSADGRPLATSATSGPLSFTAAWPDQAFEGRFVATIPAGDVPPLTMLPETPSPAPSAPGAFEVVRSTPGATTVDVIPTAIFLEFSTCVNPLTLSSRTVSVFLASGTTAARKLEVDFVADQTLRRVGIVAKDGFDHGKPGDDIVVVLTSGVRDAANRPLAAGKAGSPVSLAALVPDAVYELRTRPLTAPAPESPIDPAVFAPTNANETVALDFDACKDSLATLLRDRGLLVGTAGSETIDGLALRRLQAGVLANVSRIFGRAPDGGPCPGAFRVAFAPGSSGGAQARPTIVVNGATGASDGDRPGACTAVVGNAEGTRSRLVPALGVDDTRYLDGSYVVGTGTLAEDVRARQVRIAFEDQARAIACVVARTVGRAVGLPLRDAPYGVMSPVLGKGELTDPRTGFDDASACLLERIVGRCPSE